MSTTNHKIKRCTFRMRVEQGRPAAEQAVMTRARLANSLAKIASTSVGRRSAYAVKSRALNHGLEMGAFLARSDEQGRHHLLRVKPRGGCALHLPIGQLSVGSQDQIQVRAVLGRLKPEAA